MSYNPFTRQSNSAATGRLNQNATGSSIQPGTPVKITTLGIGLVDVSVEDDIAAFAGVVKQLSPNGTPGNIIISGSIEQFSTAFAVGDLVYISKIGGLTNVLPSIGVGGFGEGDFVVKIGMVAQNNDNPSDKDLIVQIEVVGQL